MSDEALAGLDEEVPQMIMYLSKKTILEKLGFDKFDYSDSYFPKYSFKYVNPDGGTKKQEYSVVLDVATIDKFIHYIADNLKIEEVFTDATRQKIKKRDNYTCNYCKTSINSDPKVLLEVDKINQDADYNEANLETICFKCKLKKDSGELETEVEGNKETC